jgi:hypothetical protein
LEVRWPGILGVRNTGRVDILKPGRLEVRWPGILGVRNTGRVDILKPGG